MTAVVFCTPGLIDLRAFTVMGFNAKPTKPNPIGYFGTGLKYAIAVLCRLGAKPVVWIGRDKYTFFVKTVDFRGKAFEQVWMRREKWRLKPRNVELPFTTEYGKNWQPWMVFRELESNTRDEGGQTVIIRDLDHNASYEDNNSTVIVVEGDYLIEAFKDRDKLFLNDEAHPTVAKNDAVVVRKGTAKHLYYRGVRAKDAPKPTIYTYDFYTTMGLTEDRTFESEFWVRYTLAEFVARSNDKNFIRNIVTAPEELWEHGLEIPSHVVPSDAFREVMAERNRGTGGGYYGYYARYDNTPAAPVASLWVSAPRPWRVVNDEVRDANGMPLFAEPGGFKGRWDRLAEDLTTAAQIVAYEPDPARRPREMVEGDIMNTPSVYFQKATLTLSNGDEYMAHNVKISIQDEEDDVPF